MVGRVAYAHDPLRVRMAKVRRAAAGADLGPLLARRGWRGGAAGQALRGGRGSASPAASWLAARERAWLARLPPARPPTHPPTPPTATHLSAGGPALGRGPAHRPALGGAARGRRPHGPRPGAGGAGCQVRRALCWEVLLEAGRPWGVRPRLRCCWCRRGGAAQRRRAAPTPPLPPRRPPQRQALPHRRGAAAAGIGVHRGLQGAGRLQGLEAGAACLPACPPACFPACFACACWWSACCPAAGARAICPGLPPPPPLPWLGPAPRCPPRCPTPIPHPRRRRCTSSAAGSTRRRGACTTRCTSRRCTTRACWTPSGSAPPSWSSRRNSCRRKRASKQASSAGGRTGCAPPACLPLPLQPPPQLRRNTTRS